MVKKYKLLSLKHWAHWKRRRVLHFRKSHISLISHSYLTHIFFLLPFQSFSAFSILISLHNILQHAISTSVQINRQWESNTHFFYFLGAGVNFLRWVHFSLKYSLTNRQSILHGGKQWFAMRVYFTLLWDCCWLLLAYKSLMKKSFLQNKWQNSYTFIGK